ncbi:MAG: putative ABC transport system ATP-binding protein [Candidatus Endobugula sp.]|jgi:putative ABC transport system ATP-binding protein
MTNTLSIKIEQLRFHWKNKNVGNPAVLHIPQWHVQQGESIFLHGPSGSGKSTLLNIIGGILSPTEGKVTLLGTDIHQLSSTQRDRFRAKNIGVIFQQFNLVPYLSVLDNIRLGQQFSGAQYDLSRIEALCNSLNLTVDLLHQKANQLSTGQQQRVAMIRALYHRPPLIIADEPTSALDTDTRDEFIQLLLQEGQQNNCTVLFVSHDKPLAKHFDRSVALGEINHAV